MACKRKIRKHPIGGKIFSQENVEGGLPYKDMGNFSSGQFMAKLPSSENAGDAAYNATMAGVSKAGPVGAVIGGVTALGDAIGDPIRKSAEQLGPGGYGLRDMRKAERTAGAGFALNPFKGLTSVWGDKDASRGEKALSVANMVMPGIPSVFLAKHRAKRLDEKAKKEVSDRVMRSRVSGWGGQGSNPYAQMYPYGGEVGQQTSELAELEKGEVYRTPDGSIQKVSDEAPTHSGGGVVLDLPAGTEILGKMNASGNKTYKKLGTKLKLAQDRYEKVLSDNPSSIASNTAKRMLDKIQKEYDALFSNQEISKNVDMYQDTGQEYSRGGSIKKYNDGGIKLREQDNYWGNFLGSQAPPRTEGTPVNVMSEEQFQAGEGMSPVQPYSYSNSIIPIRRQRSFNTESMGDILTTAASLAPTAYNIAQGLQPAVNLDYKDYLNPYLNDIRSTLRNRRFDINPALEGNKLAQSTYNYSLRNAAPSQAQYMGGLQTGLIGRLRADAAIRSQAEQMRNQFSYEGAMADVNLGQSVAGTKLGITDVNLKNEAARKAMLGQGLSGLSQYAQNQQLMRNQKQRDRELEKLLPSLIYNYLYNRDSGFTFKQD